MTAEEVFKNNFTLGDVAMPKHIPKYIYESMIEFAQYHVKKALDAAQSGAFVSSEGIKDIKDCIKNCYPLDNIK